MASEATMGMGAEDRLAALLSGKQEEPAQAAEAVLAKILEPEPAAPAGKVAHQERWAETNGELKRTNQALREQVEALTGQRNRANRVMYGALGVAGAALVTAGGMFLYTKAQMPRAMEMAFKIINSRGNKALSANALVLDEWAKRLDELSEEVKNAPGLPEGERGDRVASLGGYKAQAMSLRDGFMRNLEASEKETSMGGGFSYRDPYLRKEIDFNDENGGKIDLDALKAEIKANANLDATMKSLRVAMLDPVPLSEQVRRQAEADKKDGELPSLDLTKGMIGAGQGKGAPVGLPGKK